MLPVGTFETTPRLMSGPAAMNVARMSVGLVLPCPATPGVNTSPSYPCSLTASDQFALVRMSAAL